MNRGRIEHALALLISLLGVIASYLVADRVFERMPHIEDEVAYVWQARVIAHGNLTIPSPPHERSYLVPFVVDYHGQRFGKYPLGWPVILAIGVRLGIRAWINPLLAGLGVWLTYLLGKRFFSTAVGLLAAGLTVTSPFFLMNSGSLLSHPFGLVLSAAFALAWLDLFDPRRKSSITNHQSSIINPQSSITNPQSTILVLDCGLSLGALVLTRPFTAVAIAIPFGLHGLFLLIRGGWAARRRVLAIGLIALALSGLYFAWQKVVTGDALKNPYVLWWPYDQIGFGKGHGILPKGHNLPQALYNTRQSLKSGFRDLFGWGEKDSLASAANSLTSGFSWIFLPLGLWAVTFGRRPTWRIWRTINRQAWMLALVMASLVILYMAYWIGSELYGPRYYYEGLYSVTLISAAGIAFLAGWPVNGGTEHASDDDQGAGDRGTRWLNRPSDLLGRSRNQKQAAGVKGKGTRAAASELPSERSTGSRIRAWIVGLVVAGLMAYNLVVYLPDRLQGMHGLYGVSRENIRQFQALLPAGPSLDKELVIVHSDQWHFYGALLELEDPYLTTPVIFAWSIQPTVDAILHNDFPGRTVYHYYKDEPGVLYQRPRNR